MVVEVHVEGHEAFKNAAEKHKTKTVFALFCGTKAAHGQSWCPDCVAAEPVVEKCIKSAPEDAVLIHCGVGERAFWKDQGNIFRTDPILRLRSVPTLLKLGSSQRLEEAQCADDSLVTMFFEED